VTLEEMIRLGQVRSVKSFQVVGSVTSGRDDSAPNNTRRKQCKKTTQAYVSAAVSYGRKYTILSSC